MSNKPTPIEVLFVKAEDYSKTSLELFRLGAIDKSAEILSSLVTTIVIWLVAIMAILTVNIGIALWLGTLLGKTYYGFFVVATFYLLVCLLTIAFKNQWIKTPVSNSIIYQLLKQKMA